jgi:phosphoglucosamine mutase
VGRIFGTDGVRGLANQFVTAELALDLSVAAAHVLGDVGAFEGHRPVAVVGRDPRASGEFLAAAVVAGLASAGVDVLDVGVMPTPAIAFLTESTGADLGVVLSASHNPMPDNGIKFFARGGHKLADELEDAIEARMGESWQRPTGEAVGRIRRRYDLRDSYAEHLLSTLPHRLDGLTVVVDCAHGAASGIAPDVIRRAGAEVVAIGCAPDGVNINDGYGSTHLGALQAAVREHRADAGIAYDGDADRCLAVDASGTIVDGDQILAVLTLAMRESGHLVDDTVVATVMSNLGFRQAMQREGVRVVETAVGDRYVLEAMRESGHLVDDTVVATVMSNLGFRQAMQREGVRVVETAVGDRYVLEAMREGGFSLGGEQSGHVVMLDYATTGDGQLTALHLLSRVAGVGKPLAELAAVMDRLPQVMINVKGVDKARAGDCAALLTAVADAERELGDSGRVLLRSSGTEALVRVMVEAPTQDVARTFAERLAAVVTAELTL